MPGYTIGVDVGGTKILAAVVGAENRVLARSKTDCPRSDSAKVIDAVEKVIRKAAAKADIELAEVEAIGAGVPGVVDADGRCVWAPNAPLSNTPVAALLSERFGLPVAVGNDVNVGTLGEKAFGAAQEFDDVFGMFVGTGIGGGLVVGGRVIIGEHSVAAEVGHILVDYEATLRGDEGGGEYEWHASRLGMERQIRAAIAAGRSSVVADKLEGDDRLRSGVLKEGLEAGDEVVTEVMARCADIIGIATVTVIHICDPQAIVFGGGVIEACGDFMLPRIEARVRQHVAPGNGRPLRLVRSTLGDDAVALGAAALARGVTGSAPAAGPAVPAANGAYPHVAVDADGATANGARLAGDVVVSVDGRVDRRRKKLSRRVTGSAHSVAPDELAKLGLEAGAHLVVGAGTEARLTLSEAAAAWLASAGVEHTLLPTPEAAERYNGLPGPKALLLHIGC